MNFINVADFDSTKLKFSKSKNTSGRRFILAYYDKKSFGLKFPQLRIPFDSKVNQYGQLEVNVSLGSNTELIDTLNVLDEQMKIFAEEHSWGDVEYCPMVKESTNGDYPPTIKMKIPVKDGIVKTSFYDISKKRLPADTEEDVVKLMKKGAYIQTAIGCVGVWFNDERFGLTWKAEQIRIMSSPEPDPTPGNTFFCSDTDSEVSDLELLIED